MLTKQQRAVQALEDRCKVLNIQIHDGIESRIVDKAGLGIYSTCKLKAGEKLVQVPVKHIFTTDQIPESFLTQSARKDIPVHAQLAAFFASANNRDLKPYETWMATWPSLHDFTETMPIFWGFWAEYILLQLGKLPYPPEEVNGYDLRRTSKRRRVSTEKRGHEETKVVKITEPSSSSSSICLGPALSGSFDGHHNAKSVGQLAQMSSKLVSHIKAIDKALPDLRIIEDDQQLLKFLHAWCLVNTRCFYYIPTMTNPSLKKQKGRVKTPKDPNEAMALCPFMDLFNHRAPAPPTETFGKPFGASNVQLPCKVRCTATGFQVVTESAIPPNTEILLSYGSHTNDTLWSEYGFLLLGDTNSSDFIPLDDMVLESLKSMEKSVLEEHGYLGEYVLKNDGSVCYRTELAAWLLVLGSRKWVKVVSEGLDPEEECTSPTGKTKYTHTLKMWLQKAIEAADKHKILLEGLTDDQTDSTFRTMHIVRKLLVETEQDRSRLVERRRKMCMIRWDQIRDMALRGLRSFQVD